MQMTLLDAPGAAPSAVPGETGPGPMNANPDTNEGRQADDEPTAGKVYTLAEHREFAKRLDAGDMTAAELKATFARALASQPTILAELNGKTLKQLAPNGTGGRTKPQVCKQIAENILSRFSINDGITWSPFTETYQDAIKRAVATVTDEGIQKRAEARKAKLEELRKVLTNPETLAEFERFIDSRGIDQLTAEQRAKYEQLKAESTKARRTEQNARAETVRKVEAPDGLTITVKQGTHTKRQCPIWIAQLNLRVERDKYNELNIKARQLGGYFSSYGPKENHGFVFFEEKNAQQFAGITTADANRAELLQKWEAETKEQTAARLRELADSTEARANESLSQERKENTYRRANMAAHAEARARYELRQAATLRRLADAIESGSLKFLDKVRARTQVETLEHLTRSAMWAAMRATKERHDENRRPTLDDMGHAEYPWPSVDRSWLLNLCGDLGNSSGFKLVCARLAKVAGRHDGRDYISTKDRPAFRSDLWDLQGKLWGANSRRKEYLRDRFDTFNRLQAMDIRTELELRAALREYLALAAPEVQADPIRQAERALVGQNIPGYFPTPPDVVAEVLDLADIETGHHVLEPSAGNGNLLDGIRERMENPPEVLHCCEVSTTLCAILKAKGYDIVGNDFMEYGGHEYDRIVMNPPFEDGKEIDHVRHAYDLLSPGGILVSVMSLMWTYHTTAKADAFRQWLDDIGAERSTLEDGAFLESTRPTGTRTCIVKITKKG